MDDETRLRNLGMLLAVMAVVAAGFFVFLKIGFLISHYPEPALFSNAALTGAAALNLLGAIAAVIVYAVRWGGRALTSARIRRESNAAAAAYHKASRRRAAELAADPNRAKYAPLVKRGEDWTDEKIAYSEDTGATATCAHLQAIERAMRDAGIPLKLLGALNVEAKCRIAHAELESAFDPAPPVRYAEFYQGERAANDFPTAFIICDEHKSIIHCLHPDVTNANTPAFPAPVPLDGGR